MTVSKTFFTVLAKKVINWVNFKMKGGLYSVGSFINSKSI